ncbi:DUF2894 domain-containing protein [Piscinibacter terrae]|uniref:DUF2894 domain-containing protein n=1 Tax=Piscinibacter terrae TaxID=2496871 RepID=A0A3N7HKT6_9BURK|nr:DUF2894 domain-containing protein [Albitalea terrae]RQP22707.1 DUF2894 domain-containing protein [Albitalea terrae]
MNAAAQEPPTDPIASVEACRLRGGAQADAVGLGIAEALARRAAALQGEARRLLIQRLDERLHQIDARAASRRCSTATNGIATRPSALASLSALVDQLGRSTMPAAPTIPAAKSGAKQGTARPAAAPIAASPRPLKAIEEHRGTWSRLRVETRLREALARVPAGAGPLNTSHLVNRALQAMRDLSPEYLDAFMSHVDTLLRLEQASGGGDLSPRPAAHPAGKAKAVTRGTRKG